MSRWRLGVTDWAVAVAVAVTLLVTALSGHHPGEDLKPLGYGLLAAGALALAAHRWAPRAALAVTGLSALGYQALGVQVPALAYLVAVYAAVRAGHRRVTVVVSVLMLAALPLVVVASSSGVAVGEAFAHSRDVLPLAWLIAAGAAGEALRQAERRAEEAERTREETARRRADGQRLHIARELHDSLTHQISVITVQAEVAVHLARKRGDQVPTTLLAIRQAGREAAGELRATLQALRDDQGSPHGLDQVLDLVEHARMTGLDARLTIDGQRPDVPAAVQRTAYRIVQESLTNVARHAGGATASIRIDYRPDALVIQVDDDGTAAPDTTPVPGIGLLGMGERVTALGGRLRAAPRTEGGFTVRAELPVDHRS